MLINIVVSVVCDCGWSPNANRATHRDATYLADGDVSGTAAVGNHSAESFLGMHVMLEPRWILKGQGTDMDERVLLLQLL